VRSQRKTKLVLIVRKFIWRFLNYAFDYDCLRRFVNFNRRYRLRLRNDEWKCEFNGFDSGIVRSGFGCARRGGAGKGKSAKTLDACGGNSWIARFSADCRKTRDEFKSNKFERGDRRSNCDVAGLFDFCNFVH